MYYHTYYMNLKKVMYITKKMYKKIYITQILFKTLLHPKKHYVFNKYVIYITLSLTTVIY